MVPLAENGQLCNAHIVGDGEAKGKYMAVLDKDDLWEPDKLEKQVAYLEEHPDTGACFTTQSGAVQSEIPQLCGCYLDEARGVLKVTDIQPADYPPQIDGFPKGAYHIYDYQFFFRNLQENVRVRTNAYLAAHQQKAASLSDSADALRSCA